MTKIKAAVKLYRDNEPANANGARVSRERGRNSHSSLVKEAARYAEEMGLVSCSLSSKSQLA